MAAADALMLTQGWRRYDIPQVVRGLYEEPAIPLEIGQEITGRIEKTGIFRKRNFKGYTVSALVPRFGRFFRTDVDHEGRFALNGFDFPRQHALRAPGRRPRRKDGRAAARRRARIPRSRRTPASVRQIPGDETLRPERRRIHRQPQTYTYRRDRGGRFAWNR